MIQKEEIEAKSREFEIHSSNVQRDYVFGWILFGLFEKSDLKETIFLKGGNALRKGYFENTRFSPDIDLGIPGDIDQDSLLNEVNKICDFIQERSEVVFAKDENRIKEKFPASETPIPGLRVYEVRVYFKDFYGNSDHIKIKISMDITRFDKTLLPIQEMKLIHPYSDAHKINCTVRCMKLEEIIATKLKCLMQRQHAPDLFDYVYSVKLLGGNLDREEVVRTFIEKTIFTRNPHVVKDILQKTSFKYFKNSWKKAIVCAKKIIFGVEEAITFFLADLDSLFKVFPDNGFHQFAFFDAKLRVPIMEAGRKQTLLKIRYKGADRIIEPYSLKYLQRKDGVQREYFYVYNRSGGNSPPGVRSLVAENIESIENTEEKFDPQFQIELSKAGETPENPFLFDPNKPKRSPSYRRPHYGPKYVYRCGSCGKKFYRTTQKPTNKTHKSKSGYICHGYGIYVSMKY